MKKTTLTPAEIEQYVRHIDLPGWGTAGQKKLKKAAVLIVGLGGLGSVSSQYLAAAGVGRIGLIDDDLVSLSNLQRQILYSPKDVGLPKAALAKMRLQQLNPNIQIKAYLAKLSNKNAEKLIESYDLVIDGTDNFAARSVINETCVNLDKPYVFGAVNGFDGQMSVFHASQGPCLRCLFPVLPDSNREPVGKHLAVLNTVPAVIGALQATQAIKYILGMGESFVGRLLTFNALELSFNMIEIHKNPRCQACGTSNA